MFPSDVAKMVGISRTRVELLAQEGRIVLPRKLWGQWHMTPIKKNGQAWDIPDGFRVVRASRSRPGPLTDFIERWEVEHPEIMEQEHQEMLRKLKGQKKEEKRREIVERIKRNAPRGTKTAFFAPQL